MENSLYKHFDRRILCIIGIITLALFGMPFGAFSSLGYASSDDDGDDNSGSCEGGCHNVGYDDGRNRDFSEDAFQDNCGPLNTENRYYQGFIDGCMSVDGNTRDVCESATDA